jgi:CheY-like chemotaxis protein
LYEEGTVTTCIIIENDPSFIYLIKRYATKSGLQPLVASSGDGALEAARRERPAVIVLDAALPGMNPVLQKLDADPATRDVPVIAWSDPDESRRNLEGRVDCWLQTPVGYRDFVSALEKLGLTPPQVNLREGKYQPLFERLRDGREARITLTFAEIEALLRKPLPPSARASRNWWSNRTTSSPQSAAWMKAGYRVEKLDLEQGRVTFFKPDLQTLLSGDAILWNGELVRALRRRMGLNQTALARMLSVRQQTVSEWETGVYAPGRIMRRHLTEIATRSGFIPAADGS